MIQTFIMILTVTVKASKDILTRILTETGTYFRHCAQLLDAYVYGKHEIASDISVTSKVASASIELSAV